MVYPYPTSPTGQLATQLAGGPNVTPSGAQWQQLLQSLGGAQTGAPVYQAMAQAAMQPGGIAAAMQPGSAYQQAIGRQPVTSQIMPSTGFGQAALLGYLGQQQRPSNVTGLLGGQNLAQQIQSLGRGLVPPENLGGLRQAITGQAAAGMPGGLPLQPFVPQSPVSDQALAQFLQQLLANDQFAPGGQGNPLGASPLATLGLAAGPYNSPFSSYLQAQGMR